MKRLLLVTLIACHGNQHEVVTVPPDGHDPPPVRVAGTTPDEANVGQYPLTVPRLDDAALAARTAQLEAKTPDWEIALDPFGMLSSARCKTCVGGRLPSKSAWPPPPQPRLGADAEKIEQFLKAHAELLGLSGFGVKKWGDSGYGRRFTQQTSWGFVASVDVSTIPFVSINAHMWAALPAPRATLADAKLEEKLRALDATPDLTMKKLYATTAPSAAGPLELREVACLHTDLDNPALQPGIPGPGIARPPVTRRPCVDARTGEDVTAKRIGWTIRQSTGQPIERIVHYGP